MKEPDTCCQEIQEELRQQQLQERQALRAKEEELTRQKANAPQVSRAQRGKGFQMVILDEIYRKI